MYSSNSSGLSGDTVTLGGEGGDCWGDGGDCACVWAYTSKFRRTIAGCFFTNFSTSEISHKEVLEYPPTKQDLVSGQLGHK